MFQLNIMKLVTLTQSNLKGKKYKAVFETDTKRTKTIHFGASGYTDYTQEPHDKVKRTAYLLRHEKNEDWTVPDTAGSLSAHLLWGPHTSLQQNLTAFRKKFNV